MHSSALPPFAAPRWLANAHLQTLGGAVPLPLWAPRRASCNPSTEHLRMALPGGAGTLLARAWWQLDDAPHLTALLIHGIGGSSESHHVRRAAVTLFQAGFHVVRLNLRGAGENIYHNAPSIYHAGLTEDVQIAIDSLLQHRRVIDIAVLGFSLGGNTVLKLAGEWAKAPPARVRRVVAVSSPLDLDLVSLVFDHPRNLLYRVYLLGSLIQRGMVFARLYPGRATYQPHHLLRLTTIRAYDQAVTVPTYGFAGLNAYYAQASAGPWLRHIHVPTLIVHAKDDPLVPTETLTPWLSELPSCVKVAWSDQGGHIGWYSGVSTRHWVDTWAMRNVVQFLSHPPNPITNSEITHCKAFQAPFPQGRET